MKNTCPVCQNDEIKLSEKYFCYVCGHCNNSFGDINSLIQVELSILN